MTERSTLSVKPGAPGRDPRRPRVRGRQAPKAPRPPNPQNPPKPLPGPHAKQPQPPQQPVPAAPAAEGVRVSKLMTERGLCSRREADEWITAGWVRADGHLVQLGQRVRPEARIDIDPRAHQEQQHRVTVLLHKPVGWVSGQPEDGHEAAVALITPENHWDGDRSGIRFHRGHLRHLAPAGRLDIDSTGLLVFTQDGRVARHLIGDETRVEKEYLVRVARADGSPVQSTPLARLRHGLELDGVALRPAQVSWQNEDQLRVVLREGRKRQIRRMCELVGLSVLGLKRVRIGSVPLGPLPAGRWRYLREDERF